jgi:hypothetical protein
VPIGTVTIRTDKNGTDRRWIEVTDGLPRANNWRPYAPHLWEQAHGPIPKGMMVHHLDGNALNDAVSNYGLVSRSGHINEHRLDLLRARIRPVEKPGKGFVRASNVRDAQGGLL